MFVASNDHLKKMVLPNKMKNMFFFNIQFPLKSCWKELFDHALKVVCLVYRHCFRLCKKIFKVEGVPKILCVLNFFNYLWCTPSDCPQSFFWDQWQSYLKFIIKGWITHWTLNTSKKRFIYLYIFRIKILLN